MKPTRRRSKLIVTVDGGGIASHVESAALAELADRPGWTAALSVEMAATRRRRSTHDPGRLVRDLIVVACYLDESGEALAGILRPGNAAPTRPPITSASTRAAPATTS